MKLDNSPPRERRPRRVLSSLNLPGPGLRDSKSPRKMDDFMQQSIRNEIPGTVKEIISDKVLSEIIVERLLTE